MNILCTMPGKFGDILWALPTIRALARHFDTPVDFATSQQYSGILPLVGEQEYIREVFPVPGWEVQDTAPMTPWRPELWSPGGYDKVFHLGYTTWPMSALPYVVYLNAVGQVGEELGGVRLEEPWVRVEGVAAPLELAIGFTNEWFELKVGLVHLLERMDVPRGVLTPVGSRWVRERPKASYPCCEVNWLEAARLIRNSDLFLGDCSALHVLAIGLGKPVILMEPNPMRHHPIFYPLGHDGPQVTLVKGNDGLPTHDARHVREAVELALRRVK